MCCGEIQWFDVKKVLTERISKFVLPVACIDLETTVH
jgi:hypothetical protein